MNREYFLTHTPLDFHFKQSSRDFVVEEIPLYEFSGVGEHLVIFVRKKDLSTWDMCSILANYLGINAREIGYAGLKDKNALTKQYISIHKKYEEKLRAFKHEKIKFLNFEYHANKIKLGHLKGNRFFIRIKKVNPTTSTIISQAIKNIKKLGMPNFFGFQRFGSDNDNYLKGKEILEGKRKEKNVKLKKLYINSYQSYLFNNWLSERIKFSRVIESFSEDEIKTLYDFKYIKEYKKQKHPFKILDGDVLMHYPYGRVFYEDLDKAIERFNERDLSVTGLLSGKKTYIAKDEAYYFEKEIDLKLNAVGSRRYAWIYPEDVEYEYKENEAWGELHFSLPKGSYATVLLEEIAKREIN